MAEYVVGFIFNYDETQVILIKKKRPSWQIGDYNGIGGEIWKNESSIDAMIRETKEECGLEILKDDWYLFATLKFNNGNIVYCYTASIEDITLAENCTAEQIDIFEVAFFPNNLVKHVSWLIPLALETRYEETEIYIR